MYLFDTGTVDISPGAAEALAVAGVDPESLLARHRQGDWGDLKERDRQENEFALRYPHAVYALGSLYTLDGTISILVLTAADRSSTLIMLPSEEQDLEVSTAEGY